MSLPQTDDMGVPHQDEDNMAAITVSHHLDNGALLLVSAAAWAWRGHSGERKCQVMDVGPGNGKWCKKKREEEIIESVEGKERREEGGKRERELRKRVEKEKRGN